MAKLLKLRRGTTTQHASFTGAEGEVTIDTTKDTAVIHDNSTQGGTPLAKEDMSNVSSASIAGRLGTDSIATTKIAAGALPTDVTVASSNIVNGTITTHDIANDQVNFAKLQNIASQTIVGRAGGGTGDPTDLSATDVRSIINVEDGATADQTATEIKTLYESNSNTNPLTDTLLTKLNGIDTGAKDDQTQAEINALNINADTVDTLHASSFIRSDTDNTADRRVTFANNSNDNEDTIATATGSQGGIEIYNSGVGNDAFMAFHAGSDFAMYFGLDADTNDLSVGGWSMGSNKYRVWHEGNDGSGSGLDADKVDGQHMTSSSDVALGSLDLNNGVNHSGAGAIYGRNYAYDTVELSGHGAEFMMGARSSDIHINYRTCNNNAANNTPTNWYWRKGSSSSWANFNLGDLYACLLYTSDAADE